MALNPDFLRFLEPDPNTVDETASLTLTAAITSATRDENPKFTLAEIYHQVANTGSSTLLDPLHTIPLLIRSPNPAAKDLLSLLGQCSSAKEVAIAVQEAVEWLKNTLESDYGSDDDEADQEAVSSVDSLISLIALYSTATLRIKLRRKSALETIQPFIEELQDIIDYAGRRASRDEGRSLISGIAEMVEKLSHWVRENAQEGDQQLQDSQLLLRNLLEHTISICPHCIQSSVAQRTFEDLFPRLTVRPVIKTGSEEGEKSISDAIKVYTSLGWSLNDVAQRPSPPSLILLAHSSPEQLYQPSVLLTFLPIIVASIQTNSVLDESLSILLKVLYHRRSDKPTNSEISSDLVIPLTTVLPTLASGHPDPEVRHQAFRILSLLLSMSPPPLRLQILVDLTSESEFPQMRVAAVGLVKEAVLEAFSSPAPTENVFSSSMFLRAFGPLLFRPNPVNLFSSGVSLKDFQDSQEPQRLVECLSLYYVLLQQDQKNLTGIRDRDVISSVEHSLLSPLRSRLDAWMSDPSVSQSHLHDIMPLVSLKMSLERVDNAKANLKQV